MSAARTRSRREAAMYREKTRKVARDLAREMFLESLVVDARRIEVRGHAIMLDLRARLGTERLAAVRPFLLEWVSRNAEELRGLSDSERVDRMVVVAGEAPDA